MGGTTDRPNDRVSFFFSFDRKTIRKDRAWKYLLFLQRNFSEIIFYRSKIQFILELGSERRLELDQTWLDVGQSERRAYRIDRLDTFNFRPFIRNVYRKHYYRRIIKFILFVYEQVFQWEGRVWYECKKFRVPSRGSWYRLTSNYKNWGHISREEERRIDQVTRPTSRFHSVSLLKSWGEIGETRLISWFSTNERSSIVLQHGY